MQDIVSAPGASIEWIDTPSNAGQLFRIGADVAYWEGGRTLRIEAVSVPDQSYRQAILSAIAVLSERWDGPIELVLDFIGSGPPGPGEAMALCRSLKECGQVERIVVVKQPWMPGMLLSAVTRLLRASGMVFEVREVHP
jgi:hypothetical protein